MTGRAILMVHGLGSTFQHNWVDSGWVAVLEEEGYDVIPFNLPGHGTGHGPGVDGEAVVGQLLEVVESAGEVHAVGFSVGARVLLTAAVHNPKAFRSLVLMGVGDAMVETGKCGLHVVADALEGDATSLSGDLVPIRSMISRIGNEVSAVAAFARSVPPAPDWTSIASLPMRVLVVCGDRDPVGGTERMRSSLRFGRYLELRRTDHLATTSNPHAYNAVVRFLGELELDRASSRD